MEYSLGKCQLVSSLQSSSKYRNKNLKIQIEPKKLCAHLECVLINILFYVMFYLIHQFILNNYKIPTFNCL